MAAVISREQLQVFAVDFESFVWWLCCLNMLQLLIHFLGNGT